MAGVCRAVTQMHGVRSQRFNIRRHGNWHNQPVQPSARNTVSRTSKQTLAPVDLIRYLLLPNVPCSTKTSSPKPTEKRDLRHRSHRLHWPHSSREMAQFRGTCLTSFTKQTELRLGIWCPSSQSSRVRDTRFSRYSMNGLIPSTNNYTQTARICSSLLVMVWAASMAIVETQMQLLHLARSAIGIMRPTAFRNWTSRVLMGSFEYVTSTLSR